MFEVDDKVKVINGGPEIWTIKQIRENPTKYQIERDGDFATRQWKVQSELELANGKKPEPGDGGVTPAEGIM